jgi:hypothetical protein
MIVTEAVQDYRRAARHLWNEYVWRHDEMRSYEIFRLFEDLRTPLYKLLVEARLGIWSRDNTRFGERFRVVPRAETGTIPSVWVDTSGSGTYARQTGPFRISDLTLYLVDFYDWEQLAYHDYVYYQVVVSEFAQQPAFRGRTGLVEVKDADVLYVPSS